MAQKFKVNRKGNPKRDRCQTPAYAINPLLPFLDQNMLVWESALGEGLLNDTLQINGFNTVTSDILLGQDYFSYEPEHYDIQITNPPFSRKYDWLRHAYELEKPFALLMPIDVIGAGSAQGLFERYGVEIILMNKRVDYKMPEKAWDGNGAQFASAWFTWQLSIGKPIVFSHLAKPPKKRSKLTGELVHNPEQIERPEFVQTEHF